MLIIFSGLPGVGKTTLAKQLASELSATYLRVDTIEDEMVKAGFPYEKLEGQGYLLMIEVARDNLLVGNDVIVDSVSPIALTRGWYRKLAEDCSSSKLEIEVVCSDLVEHRRRIDGRVKRGVKPTWQEVLDREYEEFSDVDLRFDTSMQSLEEAMSKIDKELARFR